jgi:hypothetical protein
MRQLTGLKEIQSSSTWSDGRKKEREGAPDGGDEGVSSSTAPAAGEAAAWSGFDARELQAAAAARRGRQEDGRSTRWRREEEESGAAESAAATATRVTAIGSGRRGRWRLPAEGGAWSGWIEGVGLVGGGARRRGCQRERSDAAAILSGKHAGCLAHASRSYFF